MGLQPDWQSTERVYTGLWGFICCILAIFILVVGGLSISETFEKGGYWDHWTG